jgi:uncharacterized protein YndB with AHSA1/START domain
MQLSKVPVMKTGMLIRKPAAKVYEAFVNPEITTKFWFTRSSGRLAVGKPVKWEWEMYGVSADAVTAKILEPGERIVMDWPGHKGKVTVEWTFTARDEGTFVGVTESGYTGSGDELVQQVTDSMQGFSLVLAAAKALLEHNVRLNLVADRYPKGVEHA